MNILLLFNLNKRQEYVIIVQCVPPQLNNSLCPPDLDYLYIRLSKGHSLLWHSNQTLQHPLGLKGCSSGSGEVKRRIASCNDEHDPSKHETFNKMLGQSSRRWANITATCVTHQEKIQAPLLQLFMT